MYAWFGSAWMPQCSSDVCLPYRTANTDVCVRAYALIRRVCTSEPTVRTTRGDRNLSRALVLSGVY